MLSVLWIWLFLRPVSHPSFLQWYFKKRVMRSQLMFPQIRCFWCFFFPPLLSGRMLGGCKDKSICRQWQGETWWKKKAVVCYHSRALSLVFIKHVDLKGLVFSKSTYFELLASCVIWFHITDQWQTARTQICDLLPGMLDAFHILVVIDSLYDSKTIKRRSLDRDVILFWHRVSHQSTETPQMFTTLHKTTTNLYFHYSKLTLKLM